MGSFFSLDGLFYKICTYIYYIFVISLLWLIFSIPIVTIGASTTALFYVTGKLIRQENIKSIPSAFLKSFKLNFKQATVIWLIILAAFYIVYINVMNIGTLLEERAKYIYPIQFFVLFEILVIGIYIFPLLSRYHVKVLDAFKAALFVANKHFLTTIECLAVFPGIYLLFKCNRLFILLASGIYGFWIYFLLKGKFAKYAS